MPRLLITSPNGAGFDCAPMPSLLVKGKSQPFSVFIVRWMQA